jgi:hypothetical protein
VKTSYQWRAQLFWGLLLIGAGVLFFLDRVELFYVESIWQYWPFLFVLSGLNRLIAAPTANDVLRGLWSAFLGLWLFVSLQHVWGMSFQETWPALLIAWGVSLVLKPFLLKSFPAKEACHEH